MSPNTALNLDAMQSAVCRGVVEGNKELVAAFIGERKGRHDLRDVVQANSDKVYQLDAEVKLLKGFMVTLVGNGDGSTGMVPRLEKDMKSMGEDISSLTSDVREVTTALKAMAEDVRSLVEAKEKSQGFMAGFSGAKIALAVISTIVTILAFLIGRGFKL